MKFKDFFRKEKFEIGREILISIFVASLISSCIAYYFNKALDTRTSKRQLLYEFSRTFFDDSKYRDISIALEEQYLYNRGQIFTSNGGKFTDYQIDNYLSFLYDLYSFTDEDLAPKSLISEQYSYYVCITYNNVEIQEYRQKLLKQGFSDNQAGGFLEDFAKLLDVDKDTDCKKL